MKTKTIKITSCKACPYMKRYYVGQGNYSWVCGGERNVSPSGGASVVWEKTIAYNIDNPSEEPKTIPEWCPL